MTGFQSLPQLVTSFLAMSIMGCSAQAHTAPTGQNYEKFKRLNGSSCCNNQDCRPTRYVYDEHGALIMYPDGRPVVIPRRLLNQSPSDDGNAHWCGLVDSSGTAHTFCAILPLQST